MEENQKRIITPYFFPRSDQILKNRIILLAFLFEKRPQADPCVRSSLQNYLFSFGKTRGLGELCSYQSSPSSGPSPQPSSTVARSSTQSAVPSSPSPVSPGGTLLRQPSHFQQQPGSGKGWAPVTPPATSPLSQQHPPFPDQQQQQQQQQRQQYQAQPRQVSDGRTACMDVTSGGFRVSPLVSSKPKVIPSTGSLGKK